ncbi:hypothetical protein HK104_004104 [Borealophlyctis nickersoniae]|nr:hypothetical protein HK104_004104 [Borealophlyctis nickersoniae]
MRTDTISTVSSTTEPPDTPSGSGGLIGTGGGMGDPYLRRSSSTLSRSPSGSSFSSARTASSVATGSYGLEIDSRRVPGKSLFGPRKDPKRVGGGGGYVYADTQSMKSGRAGSFDDGSGFAGGEQRPSAELQETREALMVLKAAIHRLGGEMHLERAGDVVVNEIFELALDAEHHDLGEDQRAAMRKLSKDKKIHIIKQAASTSDTESLSDVDKSPRYYIDLLNGAASGTTMKHTRTRTAQLVGMFGRAVTGSAKAQPHLKDVLAELKVQCTCQSLSWLLQFLDLGGLKALFNLLDAIHQKTERKSKHYEIETEILKVLKIIVNHHRGITDLISTPDYLNILILSLDSPTLAAGTSAADFLLALITLDYPKGHRLVLAAFEHFRATRGEIRLFRRLIRTLEKMVNARGIFGSSVGAKSGREMGWVGANGGGAAQREINEFLISAVTLIRLIVEIPPQLEYRIHLRNEMMAAGFGQVLKQLRTWAPSEFHEIMTHVDAFEGQARADHEEFVEDMDVIMSQVDMTDPRALLDALLESVGQSANDDGKTGGADKDEAASYVASILQHLLVPVKTRDEVSRVRMLRLIDLVITQIVLDQAGLDPDFTDLYEISVDDLVHGMVHDVARENEALRLKIEEMSSEKNRQGGGAGPLLNEPRQKSGESNVDEATSAVQHQRESEREEYERALAAHLRDLEEILAAVKGNGLLTQNRTTVSINCTLDTEEFCLSQTHSRKNL